MLMKHCRRLHAANSRWTVDTVIVNDSCLRTVSTYFQFAPSQLGFIGYKVMLTRGHDNWQITTQNEIVVRVNEVRSAYRLRLIVVGSGFV